MQRRLVIALGVLGAALCATCIAWTLASRAGYLLPRWIVWHDSSLGSDLDGDGTSEQINLSGRRLSIQTGEGDTVYESKSEWCVSDALVADVDTDGCPELVMLVWRRGNYGSSRPFWETEPDLRWTEHLYVMRLVEGSMRPVWMGHELGAEVSKMETAPNGSIVLTLTDGRKSTWRWNGFGFLIE